MHTITLKIQDSAYDKILFFLKKFSNDIEIVNQKQVVSSEKKDISYIGGVLHKYADNSKVNLEDSAWQEHIVKKYK